MWHTDPNTVPIVTVHDAFRPHHSGKCNDDCLARFLLMVEKGAFLGTNGWDEQYYYPLGDPTGPVSLLRIYPTL